MRKKQEINPLPGIRLKQLLRETGTTQKQLSERIYLSQQTISQIVTGVASLTTHNAQMIVSIFPDYSIEWLLGIADYKNQREKNIDTLNKIRHEGDLLETGFSILASLKGFDISAPIERLPETCQVEKVMREFNEGYIVTNSNGDTYTLSNEEMNLLQNDVCDYLEYRLNRWKKKGR